VEYSCFAGVAHPSQRKSRTSPEDRLPRVLVRLADFWKMGIRNIWVLDPEDKAAFVYTDGGLKPVEADSLTVAGSPVYLDLTEIFGALD
jgi:hypothetical protein